MVEVQKFDTHKQTHTHARTMGLPLDWFTSNQQRHIGAHRMRNLPTMTALAERAQHRNVQLHEQCLLCDSGPETAHMCGRARYRPTNGLQPANVAGYLHWASGLVGAGPTMGTSRLGAVAVAITTPSLGLAGPHDIGTEFIRQVVKESQHMWISHAKAREGLIKA